MLYSELLIPIKVRPHSSSLLFNSSHGFQVWDLKNWVFNHLSHLISFLCTFPANMQLTQESPCMSLLVAMAAHLGKLLLF